MRNLWLVNEETFDPTLKKIRSQESVFTIGNGYFGTRGAFEEGYPGATSATLVFGLFDSVPIAKEELANIPDWTVIQLFVNGERFRLNQGQILAYHRSLSIKDGILKRTVHWESPGGIRLQISTERFASLADEHLAAIRYVIQADHTQTADDIHLSLRAGLNTAQGNYDVMHCETVDQGHEGDLLWLLSETRHMHEQIAQTVSIQTDASSFMKEIIDSDIDPSIRLTGKIKPGDKITLEKIVTIYTSRDGVDPLTAGLKQHAEIIQERSAHFVYDSLLARSQVAWNKYWEKADVIIEGDELAQLGVRYNIYQLRISASTHDKRYSIAAKGLTGFGYRGHIFHDTEIFMLPFFIYTFPEIARNLLLYRYQLLPGAREKAANNGFKGAQYPWESTLDGTEVTPPSIIHPETGENIPVLNGFIELHITSSIAYSVWEYWQVSGDDQFMHDYGVEMLLSTALFWTSRAEKHEDPHNYTISNVIGPDEWHEHVNNNSHTNTMARHNIRNALHALAWLKSINAEQAHKLEQDLKITNETLEQMEDVQQHLVILQDPETGLFEQFEGFFKLLPLDQTHYASTRHDSYQGLLGVDKVQEYQIVKQADVLMLLTLLRTEFDEQTKEANWNYYFPITDHDYGSSLTPALHAILGSQLGHIEDAYRLFMKGALVDLDNLRGNTPEGIHDACSGAVWQAVIFGFAGLRVTKETYSTNPAWPAGWKRIAFKFQYRGETVSIDLRNV